MSSDQCMARTWNKGFGARCKYKIKTGGDFCNLHAKRAKDIGVCKEPRCKCFNKKHIYTWEHHGRWDDIPPKFYNNSSCWSMELNELEEKPYKVEQKIINNTNTNKLKLVTIEYYLTEKKILSPMSKNILTKIKI